MSYRLTVAGQDEPITSGQIQRLLSDKINRLDYDSPTVRICLAHMAAIERIECRGITYANQDFDVLAAAHRAAKEN